MGMTMRPAEQRWRDNVVDVLLRATMVEGSPDRTGTPVPVVRADRMILWARACIVHDLTCASEMAAMVTITSLASVVEGTDDIVSTAVGCLMREARLSAGDAKRAILSGSTMATGGSARSQQARALLVDTMGAMWAGEARPSVFELTNMIEQLASLRAVGSVAVSVEDEAVAEPTVSEENVPETPEVTAPEQVPGSPVDTQTIADAYQLPREALDQIARIVRESSMQAVREAIKGEAAQAQVLAEPESEPRQDVSVPVPVSVPESEPEPEPEPALDSAEAPVDASSESSDEPEPETEEEWVSRITDDDEESALNLLNVLISDPGGWESGDDVAEYAQNTMEVAAGQEVADDSSFLTLILQRMDTVADGIYDCDPEQCTQFLIQLVHLKLPDYPLPDDVDERTRSLGETLATGHVPLWAELLRAVGYIDDDEPLTYDIDESGDSYRNLVNGYVNYNEENDETQYLLSKVFGPQVVTLDQ